MRRYKRIKWGVHVVRKLTEIEKIFLTTVGRLPVICLTNNLFDISHFVFSEGITLFPTQIL